MTVTNGFDYEANTKWWRGRYICPLFEPITFILDQYSTSDNQERNLKFKKFKINIPHISTYKYGVRLINFFLY